MCVTFVVVVSKNSNQWWWWKTILGRNIYKRVQVNKSTIGWTHLWTYWWNYFYLFYYFNFFSSQYFLYPREHFFNRALWLVERKNIFNTKKCTRQVKDEKINNGSRLYLLCQCSHVNLVFYRRHQHYIMHRLF